MQQLTLTGHLLEQVLDLLDAAVVVVDTRFVVRSWNEGAERAFGWSASEAIGRPVVEVIALWRYAPGMNGEAAFDAVLRTGAWHGEIAHSRRDGSKFLGEVWVGTLRDEEGQVVGFASVHRNITGYRAVEDELDRRIR